jgi:hypothetical protein
MHVYFVRRDANARRLLQSRRLLMAVHTAAANNEIKEVEDKLQAALAAELHLSVNDLKVSTQVGDKHYHTTFLFKGLEAIALGHQLETAVLANQFNPLPSHPIHRLYMEEIFDCGAHAVGATHPYDGTNDGGVTWSIPDPTGHPSFAPSSTPTDTPTEPPTHSPTDTPTDTPTTLPPTTTEPSFRPTRTPTAPPTVNPTRTPTEPPTHSPTSTPVAPQCTYKHVANTNIPSVLCNRGRNIQEAFRSGCAFRTLNEALAACESARWTRTCEGIVKDGYGYNLRGNSATRRPGYWKGISSWWRTCSGRSMVHGSVPRAPVDNRRRRRRWFRL